MFIFEIKKNGWVAGLTKREMNKIFKVAYRHVGRLWAKRLLPKHFTRQGAREYNYAPRQGESGNTNRRGFRSSYTGQKLRKFGHTNPLVYSGESRRRSRSGRITSTSSRARVTIPAPALNWHNPHSKIDMRDEVTRVSPGDAKRMLDVFRNIIMAQIAGIKKTTRKRAA